MSNPQQQTQQSQPKPVVYKIRMKPNCGRMLIDRKWQLSDGSISETMPKEPQERLNPVDVYLEPRTKNREGEWSEGPVAEVPEHKLRAMLGKTKDGKAVPHRVLDGYKMNKTVGVEYETAGNEKRETRDEWSPGINVGPHEDATFEILAVV